MTEFKPVIAVTCLAYEARVAAGSGVSVVCSDQDGLSAALEAAVNRGSSGIISFGIAGGLAPDLAPGNWVVAGAVVAGHERFPTDRAWSQQLLQALPQARQADIVSVRAPVADPQAKRRLHERTGTVAVDMESDIAARVAAARGLPFAACRVIIDPAHRALPPAALINLRPDGTPDLPAILRSVARQPLQLPGLMRIAIDDRIARSALLRGRRVLGAGLSFPYFGELVLDVA